MYKYRMIATDNEVGAARIRVALAAAVVAIAPSLALAVLGWSNAACASGGSAALAGTSGVSLTKAPDFKLKDLSGNDVKLSDYKGKVVLINFWATWCGPCRAGIPSFLRLRDQYHHRGFEIIGISLDDGDTALVSEFAKRFQISYPVVMGTMETVEAYGPINAIPTSFIVDRQGRVRSRHLGMLASDELERELKRLL